VLVKSLVVGPGVIFQEKWVQNRRSIILPLETIDGEATAEDEDIAADTLDCFQDSVSKPIFKNLTAGDEAVHAVANASVTTYAEKLRIFLELVHKIRDTSSINLGVTIDGQHVHGIASVHVERVSHLELKVFEKGVPEPAVVDVVEEIVGQELGITLSSVTRLCIILFVLSSNLDDKNVGNSSIMTGAGNGSVFRLAISIIRHVGMSLIFETSLQVCAVIEDVFQEDLVCWFLASSCDSSVGNEEEELALLFIT
jgi:hypothetical protein